MGFEEDAIEAAREKIADANRRETAQELIARGYCEAAEAAIREWIEALGLSAGKVALTLKRFSLSQYSSTYNNDIDGGVHIDLGFTLGNHKYLAYYRECISHPSKSGGPAFPTGVSIYIFTNLDPKHRDITSTQVQTIEDIGQALSDERRRLGTS